MPQRVKYPRAAKSRGEENRQLHADTAAGRRATVPQEWKRAKLGIDIPTWSDCGTFALPSAAFPPQLEMRHLASVINDYRASMSAEKASFQVCAACGRKSFTGDSTTMSTTSFIDKFAEFCAIDKNKTAMKNRDLIYTSRGVPESLKDLLIDLKGVTTGDTHVTVCGECARCVSCNRCPPLVLANGTWAGDVPPELAGLSYAEELLLSRTLRHGMVLTLHAHANHGFKGNTIVFPVNVRSTMEALLSTFPRSLDTLAEFIVVNYYTDEGNGDNLRTRLPTSARNLLTVRRKKVEEAFIWLHYNNWMYSGCILDRNILGGLPEDDVPETFWRKAFRAIHPRADVERAGYANNVQVGGEPVMAYVRKTESKAQGAQIADDVTQASSDLGISSSSLFDARQHGIATSDIRKEALKSVIGKLVPPTIVTRTPGVMESSLAVGEGTKPVNEFDLVSLLLAQCYPTLFPYGVGAPGFRPGESDASAHHGTGVTFLSHMQLLLQRSCPRFQSHRMFLFHVLNMEQRKLALRSAKQVSRHADVKSLGLQLSTVPVETLRDVVDKASSDASFLSTISNLPPPVIQLVNKVKLVTQSLAGCSFSQGKMLRDITSMMHVFGAATLFITINPHDLTNPVLLHWISEDGDLNRPSPLEGMCQAPNPPPHGTVLFFWGWV